LLGSAHDGNEFVLLDGSPALAVSDANVLARHADAVLLVVRAGSTRVEDVHATMSAFKRLGVPALGVVLVGVHSRRGRYSGSGSGRSGRNGHRPDDNVRWLSDMGPTQRAAR